MRRRIFIKQMTPAEAGDTKTHEKYVRLPNNFDYQAFFQQEGITNGSVIQVDFDAAYNGDQNDIIPLKFVYYASSNQEKRIPSLGPIFDKYNVTSSDVVYLESRTENGRTSFSISFKKDPELRIFTSPIFYEIEDVEDDIQKQAIVLNDSITNQIIYYGCPGSGKSHKVKEITNTIDSNYVFRATFHPDSDYASFVGCYKPVMEKLNERLYTEKELIDILKDFKVKGTNYPCQKFAFKYWNSLEILGSTIQKKILSSCDYNPDTYNAEISKGIALGKEFYNNKRSEIKYQFTPQTFTKAYVAAWNNPEQQIYLIIEEINRGNCAQIFGDLFQLLDRENGVSEYPIDADNDLKDYLEQELGAGHEGIKNGKLKLPSNLNILATMNTSDQSLFPMDSAFKRRWAWECVPVDYTNSVSGKFTIKIGDSEYKWHDFLLKANNRIKDLTFSEDKQMGNFFISSNVDKRQFIDKVMFYLWNDICKDEYGSGSFFRRYIDDNNPESEFSFNDLFGEENKIETILNGFMKYLAVEKIEAATSTGEEQ